MVPIMWEAIGLGVVVALAAYGAITLIERFYRKVRTQKLASFTLKLDQLPASEQEVSAMIDALLAERIAEKGIEIDPSTRREIRREVIDELARADVVR